ncbi:hypothetical protein C3L33_17128, partial [Rhododendron williamsianum]
MSAVSKWHLYDKGVMDVNGDRRQRRKNRTAQENGDMGYLLGPSCNLEISSWHGCYLSCCSHISAFPVVAPDGWSLIVSFSFFDFQNRDDARQFMKFLHPDLGVELPERSYGADCRIYMPENPTNRFKNVYDTLFDEFVLAHIFGWWGKAIMFRNQPLLWVLSIGFELMELTFRHMLPNFNECWWDSIVLDILICNWFGENPDATRWFALLNRIMLVSGLECIQFATLMRKLLLALAFRCSCPCELKFLSHHLERARKSIGLSPGPGSYTPREESPDQVRDAAADLQALAGLSDIHLYLFTARIIPPANAYVVGGFLDFHRCCPFDIFDCVVVATASDSAEKTAMIVSFY